jgi:hypothetical protein
MKKIWEQFKEQTGLEPWEYQIASLAEVGGDEYEVRDKVVMEWMQAGDFRPLLWMIKKQGHLRGAVLNLLAQMLADGQLTLKAGRGPPQDPEAAVAHQYAADAYEDCRNDPELKELSSDDLFDVVGSAFGSSEQSVRQAVTAKRKPKTK